MKALTIKEPWSSLIVNGYKKYEFRSWKTKYRGKFLIHAGKSFDEDVRERFSSLDLDYGCGEIIGEAEIVDCILVDEQFYKSNLKDNPLVYRPSGFNEKYAFVLKNVIKYDKKIPCKGNLNFWEYKNN